VPQGLFARALATLDPGYFAWVMATGIVSVGTQLLGLTVLSSVLLWVAAIAFCALSLGYVARAVWFWPFFRLHLGDPSVALAYFTFVAGADVLGTRFVMAGHPAVAAGLAGAAAAAWVVLNYGLPWSVVARAHRPVLRDFNGTWLIWVVGTQSLSIVATALVPYASGVPDKRYLAEAATCLWGLGIVLYLVLIVIILLRLMVVEVTPQEMGPAYWIAMGATAISVRAAAGLLSVPTRSVGFPMAELRPLVLGTSVTLWSFGSWWVPLLALFGLWRHLLRHFPLSYEPRLWSMVFPLGMYTVASYTLGKAGHFGFMVVIAKGWVWVGLAAWAAVLALMVLALARALAKAGRRANRPGSPLASQLHPLKTTDRPLLRPLARRSAARGLQSYQTTVLTRLKPRSALSARPAPWLPSGRRLWSR
jgi:tellurite resistance protein TehA-like permease